LNRIGRCDHGFIVHTKLRRDAVTGGATLLVIYELVSMENVYSVPSQLISLALPPEATRQSENSITSYIQKSVCTGLLTP
jgi:hypothetical protein